MEIILDGKTIPCEVVGWGDFTKRQEEICLESDNPDEWGNKLKELEKDHLIIKIGSEVI